MTEANALVGPARKYPYPVTGNRSFPGKGVTKSQNVLSKSMN